MTVIVYRSRSASFAAKRVAAAAKGLIAVQESNLGSVDTEDVDTFVRWDSFEPFELGDGPDLNPATAVVDARDKAVSRRILLELAPQTWFNKADVQVPAVIRPRRHKAGARFYVCRAASEVLRAVKRCGLGWYGSRLITKTREFRVFVVQGRVVAVSERFPANSTEIAWNLARGGRLINVDRVDWPVPALRASIAAMQRLGLGFGAVDVCLDGDGHPWVFEANTSPALRNKWTIKQIAKGLAWTDAVTPVKDGAQKPKSYAHPAVVKAGE